MTEETETTKEQYKDKFKVGDKVVLVRKYPDGSDKAFVNGDLIAGNSYVVKSAFDKSANDYWCYSGTVVYLEHVGRVVCASMLEHAEDTEQKKIAEECSDECDIGSAATSKHYKSLGVQPIELMQSVMTSSQFEGFLIGNIIKYSLRTGLKEGEDIGKESNKVAQYKMWLDMHRQGKIIDPRKDVV